MVIKTTAPPRRARSAEAKGERRDALLAAAESAFAEVGFDALTMDALAQRAGVAKGTLFLYFRTKEALFLALLERHLDAFFEDVAQRLSGGRKAAASSVAAWIADEVSRRPLLTRLLSLLHVVLESNVPLEQIVAFKRHLVEHLAAGGELLEAHLSLRSGEGSRALLRLHALVLGLWQLADPTPAVCQATEAPELAALRIDFRSELSTCLRVLLESAQRRT